MPKIFDAGSTRSHSNKMRPNVYIATYERERLTLAQAAVSFEPHDRAEHEQAPDRLVEERRLERRERARSRTAGARGRSRAPTAACVGRPNSSWLK